MYRCNDCGREFEEPASYDDYRGEFWGQPVSERIAVCPFCESGDFDEIKEDSDDEEDEEREEDDSE